MKLAKRILTAGVALALTLGLNIPAFAANVTIDNAAEGETYNAYKLFDMTKEEADPEVEGDEDKYSYFITVVPEDQNDPESQNDNYDNYSKLLTLLNDTIGLDLTLSADGSQYIVNTTADGSSFAVDENLLGTYPNGMTAAQLATELNKEENKSQLTVAGTAVGAVVPGTEGTENEQVTAVLQNLDDGYYFIDTTTGTLCILNSTDQTISEKNEAPEVEKEATVDDGQAAGTVQIGDTVTYTITITAQPGAENYVLHDFMSDGLTLADSPVIIVAEGLTEVDYTVTVPGLEEEEADKCDLEIAFSQDYLDTITEPATITIQYQAIVNKNADTGVEINNKAVLDYGQNSKVDTEEGLVSVYTYDFDLTKIDDSEEPVQLEGAHFKLYDRQDGTEPIQFVVMQDPATEALTYRVATAEEIMEEGSTTDTIIVGNATITGLAGKSYWLEETMAPEGYNLLASRVEVDFNEVMTNDETSVLDLVNSDLNDTQVENHAGSLLPSTGGMGTTILYIAGAALVLGAGVTLVVRRRMNSDR